MPTRDPNYSNFLPRIHELAAADPEGDEYALAAQEEILAAKAEGVEIDFAEAARRVYEKMGSRG